MEDIALNKEQLWKLIQEYKGFISEEKVEKELVTINEVYIEPNLNVIASRDLWPE